MYNGKGRGLRKEVRNSSMENLGEREEKNNENKEAQSKVCKCMSISQWKTKERVAQWRKGHLSKWNCMCGKIIIETQHHHLYMQVCYLSLFLLRSIFSLSKNTEFRVNLKRWLWWVLPLYYVETTKQTTGEAPGRHDSSELYQKKMK